MKRPTFLYWHLRGINRSVASERKRFWKLYPIALLSCSFGFGYVIAQERSLKPLPVSIPSVATKTGYRGHSVRSRAVSAGIEATWIGETRSGEPIRETPAGISFRF